MCFVQGVVALTVLESLSFSNVIFLWPLALLQSRYRIFKPDTDINIR